QRGLASMWARNAIQLAYGILGILCYSAVFYSMFGVRRIRSQSFVVIYSLMAASKIATWHNAWIILKLNNEPLFSFYFEWLKGRPLITYIHGFLVSHFYYVQNIDLLLLTLDRFAAILSVLKD
ncbi:hypothetical protein PENTCL1PPCAC_5525, partial [Pristionchus entomophagus]